MEHQQQILLRKLLKKNGFKKSPTDIYPDLMEFTKGEMGSDNFLIVYTYDEVEFYGGEGFNRTVIPTIEKFKELYEHYTGTDFLN